MKIEYNVKGITLDRDEICLIHEYYEAASTAEYLMENYEQFANDESAALNAGYEVRHLMDKYGYSEEDAIDKMLEDPRYNNLLESKNNEDSDKDED